MTHWTDTLPADACSEALDWCRTQPDHATAWAVCERGDWMLWLAGRLSGPPGDERRKPLVLAACDCAELALPLFEARYPNDARPRQAIETARAWSRREATLDAMRDAAADAYAAAYAAADAAYAAADAAYAADAADAAAAADAAYAAADAAYAADAADAAAAAMVATYAADARRATHRQCADIVRRYYPEPPVLP